MKEICRECCCWDAGSGGCTVALVGHDDATCVSALSRRVEGLERGIQRMTEEARETKPSLTPGLERAREVLRELARGWADATADHLMDAIRAGSGPERETAARLTEECAIRRSALLSAADGIGEEAE